MNQDFISTLSGTNKIFYTWAYDFHMETEDNPTEESAHEAGLDEIIRIARIKEESSKPQMYVNLRTGRKFMSTENELESMHS